MLNQIFLSLGFLSGIIFCEYYFHQKELQSFILCYSSNVLCRFFNRKCLSLYCCFEVVKHEYFRTPPPKKKQQNQPTITKLGLLCYGGGGDKQNYYRPLPATSGDFVNTIWRKRQQEIHCFYYKLATPTSICTSSCRSLFINSHVE